MVLATHWHDDHIRGLSNLLGVCSGATFCCPLAMTKSEFCDYVELNTTRNSMAAGPGTKEIHDVFSDLKRGSGRELIYAVANKRILLNDKCEIWSLSPSDDQCTQFLSELTALMPQLGREKRRVAALEPNHNSVVVQVCWGSDSILLGGDLEQTSSTRTGWNAVLNSTQRPRQASNLFKIPHHGSENAHNDRLWEEMLVPNAVAATTPYSRGRKKLPALADVERIKSKTDNAFLAKVDVRSPIHGNSSVVAKTIRETTRSYEEFNPSIGVIRMRKVIDSTSDWSVQLSPNARHFSDIR